MVFSDLLRTHATNILLLVLVLIAMFWRIFLFGETLVDVNTLNNQLPWGYSSGPSDYPYNRRDLTDTYVTRDYFVAQAYRDGEIPLWNPYTMAGHPIYADGVTRIFSPFLLFYGFLDVPLGYSVARIVELMLAAFFMYLFLISIGVGPRGSLLGALVFELSAHAMLHLTGLGWWGGMMWLPLMALFADRAVKRGSFTSSILAGVCMAAQFFCGYLPNQIYYVGGLGLYYLLLGWILRRFDRLQIGFSRVLVLMTVSMATGLVLAATQWVPSLELLGLSNRKVVGADLGYVFLPPWYALTLIFPNLFGTAYDTNALNLFTALGVSHDHILYIGIVGLVLASVALCYPRWRGGSLNGAASTESRDTEVRIKVFAIIAAISALIMMSTPLYVAFTRFIPILRVIRVAVRAGVLFEFAAAGLVGIGAELILSAGDQLLERMYRVARRLVVLALLIAVLGSGVALVLRATDFAAADAGRGKIAFLRKSAAVLSPQFLSFDHELLLPLLFAFGAATAIWLLLKKRINPNGAFALLGAMLIADLFVAGGQFDHSFDRSRVFPRTEITDLLKALPPGRVLVSPSDLETNRRAGSTDPNDKIIAPPNTLLPYQIPTVSGKNQQFPRWYREFAGLIEPQNNLSHVVFDQAKSPFFDMLNVRYVLTHSGTKIEGYDLLRTAEGVSLFENKRAAPRAWFASRVSPVSSPNAALEVLRSESNASGEVAIEGQLPEEHKLAVGETAIVEDRRNRVVVETQNEGDGLLVLSDNYYPGWAATVDGRPAEVLRANRTMRAVRVPAGRHMVSFMFKPTSFWLSAYISASAAVVLLAIAIGATLRRVHRDREG